MTSFVFDPNVSSAVATSVAAGARASVAPSAALSAKPLAPDVLRRIHRYWMATNYLTVGQIFLQENSLLREPLRPEHIKPRLLGHWGTSPGFNLLYVHLNRIITERDADVIY